MRPRLPIALGVLALVACGPETTDATILGVAVEWPVDGPHPVRVVARAVCDAAEAAPDARLLDGASVVVVDDTGGWCLRSPAVHGCWMPDLSDSDGAGTIYIEADPPDGGQIADASLRHELGHLARWRWLRDSDEAHEDLAWWARFDSPLECR